MTDFFEKYEDKIVQVSESGCWIWMGSLTPSGYGQASSGVISDAGNRVPAGTHRLSFEAQNGPIPDGAHVLHRCDVRCCVNPDHLFLGDQDANMKDMASKGRSCLGSKHGQAILTAEDVRKIRRDHIPRKVTAKMLAGRFGVSKRTVRAILERQTWKHI